MKVKDIIGLISALVLAVAVAFLTRYLLTREGGKKTSTVHESNLETMKVLVAGKVLNEGDTIKPGDLIWLDWPKRNVQTNFVTPNVTTPQNLLGAVVRHHVSLKAPINLSDLAKPGERGLLAAIISPGMHAISIDVNAQSVSSGLIFPGDRVDIIFSKSVGGTSGVISKTIVKNIKVLAIDVETSSTREKPKIIPRVATLEVTERQAETITAAAKDGTLSLSLRSLSKGQKVPESGEAEAEEGGQKDKRVVVIRGNERTEVQVRE